MIRYWFTGNALRPVRYRSSGKLVAFTKTKSSRSGTYVTTNDADAFAMLDASKLRPDIREITEKEYHRLAGPQLDIGVLITSNGRGIGLRRAIASCVENSVSDVVIVVTNPNDEVERELTSASHHTVIVRPLEGTTSNDAWVDGLKRIKSRYVTILHDDDMLLPNWRQSATSLLKDENSYLLCGAIFHDSDDKDNLYQDFGEGSTRSERLNELLTQKGILTITPVRCVCRTEDAINALLEAGSVLTDDLYRYRTDFIVGNDLWLWLYLANRYPRFAHTKSPLVSLGCSTSTTVHAVKSDGAKRLIDIYDATRDVFRASRSKPIISITTRKPEMVFVTIVLNGMPWIGCHLPVLNRLSVNWKWIIIEGAAAPRHCTSWCNQIKPQLSSDGTSSLLDALAGNRRVKVIRRKIWDGKVSMFNAALSTIDHDCVLHQIDADEMWSSDQLETVFLLCNDSKGRLEYWCRYWFGPHLVMDTKNCYGNNPEQEWRRTWFFTKGNKFATHEPPSLVEQPSCLIAHEETNSVGLVFDHYGYATLEQVKFKEQYYGYKNATSSWKRLQDVKLGEHKLHEYLPWVPSGDPAVVRTV